MKKSYNDICAQVERCIALADEIGGKYKENAKNRVDTQYFYQIGRRVMTQRGIPIFVKDKDEKHALIVPQYEPQAEQQTKPVQIEAPRPEKVQTTPTIEAQHRMSFEEWMNSDEANRKRIQDACRHRFINKMYAELLTDMKICELENWDVLEFPMMLRDALTVCLPKQPVQLSLF